MFSFDTKENVKAKASFQQDWVLAAEIIAGVLAFSSLVFVVTLLIWYFRRRKGNNFLHRKMADQLQEGTRSASNKNIKQGLKGKEQPIDLEAGNNQKQAQQKTNNRTGRIQGHIDNNDEITAQEMNYNQAKKPGSTTMISIQQVNTCSEYGLNKPEDSVFDINVVPFGLSPISKSTGSDDSSYLPTSPSVTSSSENVSSYTTKTGTSAITTTNTT